MSLIQSARLIGHDPYVYLMDVLTRLHTQKASEIVQLLPLQWVADLRKVCSAYAYSVPIAGFRSVAPQVNAMDLNAGILKVYLLAARESHHCSHFYSQ